MLIDEYFEYCNKYKATIKDCVVLIQVGDFFEIYGVPETKEGEDIFKLCSIMEIENSLKKKVTTTKTKSQPYMAGFPLYCINKYSEILTNNNYTVIVIEQTTPAPNPKREVTKIISPSLNINNSYSSNNFLLTIYFTSINFNKNNFLMASLSYIDVITNESFIYECVEHDTQLNLEEIIKIINLTIKPTEIVIFTDSNTKTNIEFIGFIKDFINNLPHICIHDKTCIDINENYFKLAYQKSILEKVYKNIGLLSVIEFLNLNKRPLSVISFCYLIQFIYEHSEKLLEGIQKPEIIDNDKYMLLINNVVQNLNIISSENKSGKKSSLISLLNNCKTLIGKRYFKKILLNPITDIETINIRYDMIDFFKCNKLYDDVRDHLTKISDLERLFKRIRFKNLHPYELLAIHNSFLSIVSITNILISREYDEIYLEWNTFDTELLEDCMKFYTEKFDFSKINKLFLDNISENIFLRGVYEDIDNIQDEIKSLENMFENICLCLNQGNEEADEFKLKKNTDNIKTIYITKCRYEKLSKNKEIIRNINLLFKKSNNTIVNKLTFEDFEYKPLTPNNKKDYRMIFTEMDKNQLKLSRLEIKMKKKIIELYFENLTYFVETYEKLFTIITKFISLVDLYSLLHLKKSSLISLLNNCKTLIGKRYFKKILLNPITDIETINIRYDMIDFFKCNKLYDDVRDHLTKISDLERLFKRIRFKNLHPYELLAIHNSFLSIVSITNILISREYDEIYLEWNTFDTELLEDCMKFYTEKFDFSKINKLFLDNISENIFLRGVYEDIDNIQDEIKSLENMFENICLCLNQGNEEADEFKLKKNTDNIKTIYITKCRYEKLSKNKEIIRNINLLFKKSNNTIVNKLTFEDFEYKPLTPNNKKDYRMIFTEMDKNQLKLSRLEIKMKKKIIELYFENLTYFVETYEKLFTIITKFISLVDLYSCNAKNSIDYVYNRPIISETSDNSFISAKNIRHPLIEVIQTSIPYIANDVEIGTKNNNGILLYGLNSSGKSSYMKSIGMNLIMAQAGMFVSSENFTYYPYKHLFSRMPSGDNLFEGKSTYVCEITELRTILKRSTCRSLVIGDELCSGTEVTSAIAIIAAGINKLAKIGCSFIFASHLHELCDIECIKKIENMNIYHLSVEFDKINNCLVYDRKLKKGNGDTLYGLEIAKSLGLPEDFLSFAEEVRKDYINISKNFVEPKVSNYSSEVYMDKCSICDNKVSEDTNHIIEQKFADENGLILSEQIHKNRKSNLMPVCKYCHNKITNKQIYVDGFEQTSMGIKLKFENKLYIDTDEEKNIKIEIQNLRNKGYSFNKILETVKKEKKDITLYKIKKLLKEK